MLTIRLRKRRFKSTLSKNILEFVVIQKGKALKSYAQKIILGTFNKKMNILLINLDILYYWVGLGVSVTTPAFRILNILF